MEVSMKFLDYQILKEQHHRPKEHTWWFEAKNLHPDVNAIKVIMYYDLGGYNYFSSQTKPRGYFINITPVQVSEHTEMMSLFGKTSGGYVLLEQTDRYSQKKFDSLMGKAQEAVDKWAAEVVRKVKV
jgi:hypothetical protein